MVGIASPYIPRERFKWLTLIVIYCLYCIVYISSQRSIYFVILIDTYLTRISIVQTNSIYLYSK